MAGGRPAPAVTEWAFRKLDDSMRARYRETTGAISELIRQGIERNGSPLARMTIDGSDASTRVPVAVRCGAALVATDRRRAGPAWCAAP